MNAEGRSSASAAQRLLEELRKYALISAYLFVCFAVILIYGTSMQGEGAQSSAVPWSMALIKALVDKLKEKNRTENGRKPDFSSHG